MKINIEANTNGDGLWTNFVGPTKIVEIVLDSVLTIDSRRFGHLHAILEGWDYDKNNIVYTDPLWISEFNAAIVSLGGTEVSYSESGMQGKDFVDFDIDEEFLNSPLGIKLIEEYESVP